MLAQADGQIDAQSGTDLASMDFATMEHAVRIALTATANATLRATA